MSRSVYQTMNRVAASKRVGRGSINVTAVVFAAWRRSHPQLVHRWERIEEREAVRYWHLAQTEAERSRVERLYQPALRRWQARVKAARGDAERLLAWGGGEDDGSIVDHVPPDRGGGSLPVPGQRRRAGHATDQLHRDGAAERAAALPRLRPATPRLVDRGDQAELSPAWCAFSDRASPRGAVRRKRNTRMEAVTSSSFRPPAAPTATELHKQPLPIFTGGGRILRTSGEALAGSAWDDSADRDGGSQGRALWSGGMETDASIMSYPFGFCVGHSDVQPARMTTSCRPMVAPVVRRNHSPRPSARSGRARPARCPTKRRTAVSCQGGSKRGLMTD